MKNKIILIIVAIISFTLLVSLIYLGYFYNKEDEGREIERKWLINKEDIPYDLTKASIYEIEQTYLCFSPEIRIRKINNGAIFTLTIKADMTANGLSRDEREYPITEEEYNNLLTKKESNSITIHKTRYQFYNENNILTCIDIFKDDLASLVYMEIEFKNERQANSYTTPSWVIKDVTSDINYKNGYLARYGIPDSFYKYIND